ncbi:hypothetical protein DWV64_09785 [Bifidobacterium longum]|uniref:Uncharacterized protein n=1 Tax=Bifidobacterium longum TaxID=216816 RepID=A0A395XYM7_BIFLN|nr:hypothetical protein DWV64_09785 [Bifidobacterium longum]RGW63171.1 hypothetical protein DWV59_10535 [Bifidobacterium longum]
MLMASPYAPKGPVVRDDGPRGARGMMADADGRDRPVTGVEREAAGVFDENARLRGPDPRAGAGDASCPVAHA